MDTVLAYGIGTLVQDIKHRSIIKHNGLWYCSIGHRAAYREYEKAGA